MNHKWQYVNHSKPVLLADYDSHMMVWQADTVWRFIICAIANIYPTDTARPLSGQETGLLWWYESCSRLLYMLSMCHLNTAW